MAEAKNATILYKDCLRLVEHFGREYATNVVGVKKIVRREFKANRLETDPEKIRIKKNDAVNAINTYLVYAASKMIEKERKFPHFVHPHQKSTDGESGQK
eukprot:TRINITY_DN535_c1_g1_i1.p1 TRINITY_DN535_c1_g1~~TRINITY_DN535_c1_g1_i1.p1  ORF type:complete len:100 (-),score=45.13 TRINITY_DN535_c1_g1_i1:52-351(-)